MLRKSISWEVGLWTWRDLTRVEDPQYALFSPPWCGPFWSRSSFLLSPACFFLCTFQLGKRIHPCTGQSLDTLWTDHYCARQVTFVAWTLSELYLRTFPWYLRLRHSEFSHLPLILATVWIWTPLLPCFLPPNFLVLFYFLFSLHLHKWWSL